MYKCTYIHVFMYKLIWFFLLSYESSCYKFFQIQNLNRSRSYTCILTWLKKDENIYIRVRDTKIGVGIWKFSRVFHSLFFAFLTFFAWSAKTLTTQEKCDAWQFLFQVVNKLYHGTVLCMTMKYICIHLFIIAG